MTDKELMQQALEALEEIADEVFSPYDSKLGEVILALRDRLAQPEQETVMTEYKHQTYAAYKTPDGEMKIGVVPEQEPVAWRTFDGEGGYDYRDYDMNENYADEWAKRNPNHKGWVDALYTTSPRREWQGLTDEDMVMCESEEDVRFARAIEAKLKEKNA